jgi:hypothetical protein
MCYGQISRFIFGCKIWRSRLAAPAIYADRAVHRGCRENGRYGRVVLGRSGMRSKVRANTPALLMAKLSTLPAGFVMNRITN